MMRFWISLSCLWIAAVVSAQERRAPAPKFSPTQLRGIFFDKLEDGLRGDRPSLSAVRDKRTATELQHSPLAGGDPAAIDDQRWVQWIESAAIEDEVKRLKLHFDSIVTTPSAFSGGGFQEARLDLTVLATLFAVIEQYNGDIRWKSDAAVARDLLARTAFNCKAGSSSVYNEAKLRKADLQDLISGAGLPSRSTEATSDWSQIADRSPLMEYADSLIEALEDATVDAKAVQAEIDSIKRNAQLIALLGQTFTQPGMDDADDEDYAKLGLAMAQSARDVSAAVEQSDPKAVRTAVGNIRKRCDACHEQYR